MVNSLKLLALDIDGVLTDGRVLFSADGVQFKQINFQDADSIIRLTRSGMKLAFVTGESGPLVDTITRRFDAKTIQNAKDKLAAIQDLARDSNVSLSEICYVGDADRDAPALRVVGLGLAPASATPAARQAAHRVLQRAGGDGAVAEAIALVEQLVAQQDAQVFDPELRRIIEESIAAHQRLLADSLPILAQIAQTFIQAIRRGNKLLFFGNGGSAADAQHVAGELMGRFLKESEPWPAISLSTDTSILTAVGNDWAFEDVFARQVRGLVRPGDVVIGISTSGNSPNVLRGLADARVRGATTIGFTGARGKAMQEATDICFLAPADTTPRIQELHILAWHSICEIVEAQLVAD
jgi:D-sedoheptulose 7-phosphate isomerase